MRIHLGGLFFFTAELTRILCFVLVLLVVEDLGECVICVISLINMQLATAVFSKLHDVPYLSTKTSFEFPVSVKYFKPE